MNIAVCGLGRTGKEVIKMLLDEKNPDLNLVAAFCRTGSDKAGQDTGEYIHMPPAGISIQELDEVDNVLANQQVDVVIDFSSHVASMRLVVACYKSGTALVVCTTGFDKEEVKFMYDVAEEGKFGLVYAPNVTLGVNVLINLAQVAAKRVPEFDFIVSERHHKNKKDPVSATAYTIRDYVQNALPAKHKQEVPVNAVRAGGYVGYHEVLIVGENERISIIHESFSRRSFAEGAIRAARFINGHKGFYDMQSVLKDMPFKEVYRNAHRERPEKHDNGAKEN